MTKINEVLMLDLNEDIKSVIDLENRSETEIQQEIESYIVTEGIAKHLYDFINEFTSNIKETGVWISGFYGSGKSYFGKMLGHILDNPLINGTGARDRFIPRLRGVSNESLIENSIRRLNAINSNVIFLDVAKQNTDNGLAFTLFTNFLKSLSFRADVYGYMEFDLLIDGKYDEFKSIVQRLENKDWEDLKQSNRQVARVMHKVFAEMGYSDDEYKETKEVYNNSIDNFSSNKFKEELEKYVKFNPDKTLVFIFDEASEAISQKKFNLLDLEGISESLSSISNKVWTIAIAQEKLDDVINNANVNKSMLTKVTDRFKTKLHLESTEVDIIIKSRLLQKTDLGKQLLEDYYKTNEGLISDATNLRASISTKTNNSEDFYAYYPFHKYQFDLLQKFLFSSNALVASQIAARGMIITTFDVLRKQLSNNNLYNFTTGSSICTEAQTAPPSSLVNKYDTAKKILKNINNPVDGELLLKTIHLLGDSDIVQPTAENITKCYISDISKYYDMKPSIDEALQLLKEEKILLYSNHNYKITSDIEGKLLDEMQNFTVELYSKKRSLINFLKDYKIFNSIATYNEGTENFKFSILSDQDDELTSQGKKELKVSVYSLFNMIEDRQEFIEKIKFNTQHQKELITIIPNNDDFAAIDKLLGNILRYTYMESNYSHERDQVKRKIIREFSIIREEQEKELRLKVMDAYFKSSIIYLFDENLVNENTFKGTISNIQKKLIKNVFTKRLKNQLSEALVPKIFSNRKEHLHKLFAGDEFLFFDKGGNFVGEHLKVVEEITSKIKVRANDGRSLESTLSGAPWGYSFGTVVSTLAVLFKAGRLSVKYNSKQYFSVDQKEVHEAFINTTKFKSASFKHISKALSSSDKNKAVDILLNLDIKDHINKPVDWNISDYDLAENIRLMADTFIGAIKSLQNTINNFDSLFSIVLKQQTILQGFTGTVTENNYYDKVMDLINNSDDFTLAIKKIIQTQKFIKVKYPKIKKYKLFIEDVEKELKKETINDDEIKNAHEEFNRLSNADMVKNYGRLNDQFTIVKDLYFKRIKIEALGMTDEYKKLNGKIEGAITDLKNNYPSAPNEKILKKLNELSNYCKLRIIQEPSIEYSITCDKCNFSLADMINYRAMVNGKENEYEILKSSFVSEDIKPVDKDDKNKNSQDVTISIQPKRPRKIKFQIDKKIMTVGEYKNVLTEQLGKLANSMPDDEIELEIEMS